MGLHTVERIEDVPEPTPDAAFVVVDVITASTTIVALLDQGARYVRPFADADAAREFGATHEEALLVGEKQGAPLSGFDFLPLPTQFQQVELQDRPVGICTTNGTRAVDRLGEASGLLVGSTTNAAAVAGLLAEYGGDRYLVGVGQAGVASAADSAGVKLIEAHVQGGPDSDQRESIREEIADCSAAQWLRSLGLGTEVDTLLGFDSSRTVPRLRDGAFVAN
jgi:2-phosphosulfolactate phosphatase